MSFFIEPKDPDIMDIDSGMMYVLVPDAPPCKANTQSCGNSALETLSYHIFAQIASQVEPVWLYNLSHASKTLNHKLSNEGGANRIWYDAVPPTIWAEEEKYQSENQLEKLALFRDGNLDLDPETRNWQKYLQALARAQLKRSIIPVPSPKKWPPWKKGVSFWSKDQSQFPQGGLSFDGTSEHLTSHSSQQRSQVAVSARSEYVIRRPLLPHRPLVRSLGGSYQAIFDYKREIMGRLREHDRCNICLLPHSDTFRIHMEVYWGIAWCPNCLERYIISYQEISRRTCSDNVLYMSQLIPMEKRGKTHYFLPELNHLMMQQGFPSLELCDIAIRRSMSDHQREVLGNTILERTRRQLRRDIVRAAELLWMGTDPIPTKLSKGDGTVLYVSRADYADLERYKCFRERFAPTSQLHKFLFPEWKLSDNPKKVPYSADGGWMRDPTQILLMSNKSEYPDLRVIVSHAKAMLEALTDFSSEQYYYRNHGGNVDTWVRAANDYHTARLEKEIEDGHVVRLANYLYSSKHFEHIHTLRQKIGLEDKTTGTIKAQFTSPDMQLIDNQWHEVMLSREERAAKKVGEKKVAIFNKIVRETCNMCPVADGLFFPMGIAGLLKHVRTAHDQRFWTQDDFMVIG